MEQGQGTLSRPLALSCTYLPAVEDLYGALELSPPESGLLNEICVAPANGGDDGALGEGLCKRIGRLRAHQNVLLVGAEDDRPDTVDRLQLRMANNVLRLKLEDREREGVHVLLVHAEVLQVAVLALDRTGV